MNVITGAVTGSTGTTQNSVVRGFDFVPGASSSVGGAFNNYNTYTDASNYERLAAYWSSNIAIIEPQKAGTGSSRTMRIGNASGGAIQLWDNQFGFAMASFTSAFMTMGVNLSGGGAVCYNFATTNCGINSGSQGAYFLGVAAGTTAKAAINLLSGIAPTAPNNGDIWFDGTDLKMRIGGVTKVFTLV